MNWIKSLFRPKDTWNYSFEYDIDGKAVMVRKHYEKTKSN